jgi:hypothetical protein
MISNNNHIESHYIRTTSSLECWNDLRGFRAEEPREEPCLRYLWISEISKQPGKTLDGYFMDLYGLASLMGYVTSLGYLRLAKPIILACGSMRGLPSGKLT